MDQALDQLEQTSTIIFGACIVLLTFFIRRLVETTFPSLRKKADENAPMAIYEHTMSRYWNQVILYALPSILGSLIALFNIPYLYGDPGPKTLGGRVFMGIFVGGASAFVYKAVKKRWGIDLNTGLKPSSFPPPDAETPAGPPPLPPKS